MGPGGGGGGGRGCEGFYLRKINIDSVFGGLKVTSHLAAHCVILPKSALIQAAAVMGHRRQYKHLYHLQKVEYWNLYQEQYH